MAPRGFDCCNPGNAVIKQHQQSAQLSQHEFVTMTQKALPPPAAPAAVLQTHTRSQALAGRSPGMHIALDGTLPLCFTTHLCYTLCISITIIIVSSLTPYSPSLALQ
jgi:hypothetical protein